MPSAEDSPAPLVALAAVDHLPAQRYALAREACEGAMMAVSAWRHKTALALGNDWPALVIAGLPSGARRLPPDLHILLTERFPRLPLVLLCEEALVRPTVVTHGGRIVLIGAPLTSDRIASRIRMLTAIGAGEHNVRQSSDSAVGCDVRDRLSARHWVGCFRRGPPGAAAALTDGADGSLTVLLPLAENANDAALLRRISEEFSRELAPSAKEAALTELLGDRYAALHLPQSGEQWTVYRTSRGSSLRLCSPRRLPRLWDHPRASTASRLFVKRAASGDVLVMSSAGEIPPWDEPSIDPWVGGPGLLARLAGDVPLSNAAQSTVVVEVL